MEAPLLAGDGDSDSEQSAQWAASHGDRPASTLNPVPLFGLRPEDRLLTAAADVTLREGDLQAPASVLPAVRAPSRHARSESFGASDKRPGPAPGLRLKCKHGSDTRVVAVSSTSTFQSLYARLVTDYGFELTMK